MRILLILAMLSLAAVLHAEESPLAPPPPASINLPAEEVLEYRALEAEIRALRAELRAAQAEVRQAVEGLSAKREAILEKWKNRAGEKDLSGWQLDLEGRKLNRKNIGGTP